MFCQNGQCTLGKKPVEWFDLSRQLFLARHAACVAVKSAFLRDHLNAAACQVCNRPIRQLPVNNHQLPITSLSPIARCPLPVGLRISCCSIVWCADLPPEVGRDVQQRAGIAAIGLPLFSLILLAIFYTVLLARKLSPLTDCGLSFFADC